MNTLILKSDEASLTAAAEILRNGGLVAVPTETVYGLAADALRGECVKKIFAAKGRPADNPLIVHIADTQDIRRFSLTESFPENAKKLAEAFWPGPLTMILKKGDCVPDEVTAGLDTVALRMPSHDIARKLIRLSGKALAAPSANSSGRPSPTKAEHVIDDLRGKIDAVVDGGECEVGVESTVITLASPVPRILRPGVITKEQIEAVIGEVEVDKAVLDQLKSGEKASSPGMKYRHYSPKTRVILVRASDKKYRDFMNKAYSRGKAVAALGYDEDKEYINAPFISLGKKSDPLSQTKALFDSLRRVDLLGVDTAYARCPEPTGAGMALYNRLIRACAFNVITLPECRVIGLTGQTGAGKGEVSAIFASQGAKVIDADSVARQAVEDDEVKKALAQAFPDIIKDGVLDRRKLADRAFSSEEKQKQLNEITHPKIISLMLDKAVSLCKDGAEAVVFDAPTLFEANADIYCDVIVSILADEDIRLSRITERDNISESSARIRMSAQRDEDFFRESSDFVLYNNGSLEQLKEQALSLSEVLFV